MRALAYSIIFMLLLVGCSQGQAPEGGLTATLSVTTHDGVIFPATEVNFREGESVFDVLQREMRTAGIHMSARFVPITNTAYVEAIANVYEFEQGALSGWTYLVNGDSPSISASSYSLTDGDAVEWVYTRERL
ncbi:MAG: DUF4430 domain-containing protein [Defluviitaleaceae bacterium]|nr:DUF4430 domain-containing protein [Defluviitaleaceae bacterium]